VIRRSFLAALALLIVGGVAAPALASAGSIGTGICVLGTNHTNGTRDGICVWMPGSN
jgi:hypothetical protein